jgi:hypothetical protein
MSLVIWLSAMSCLIVAALIFVYDSDYYYYGSYYSSRYRDAYDSLAGAYIAGLVFLAFLMYALHSLLSIGAQCDF